MVVRAALTILALQFAFAGAFAAPVAIQNAGFEANYLGGNLPPQYNGDVPATAFPTGNPPTGWQSYGAVGGGAFVGVLNPGVQAVEPMATYFPAGAAEGDNVALLFYDDFLGGAEFGIQQTLAATLTANTVYTLTTSVGNIASGVSVVQPYAGFGIFDLRGFPGYRIELRAGTEMIAVDNNTVHPGEGLFSTSVLQASIGATHAQLGQPLVIRLVNLNQPEVFESGVDLEVDFDAISLDASLIAPGDFNADGVVNAVDYTIWRNHFGESTEASIHNNGNGGLGIDEADFTLWKQRYGTVYGSGAGGLGQVPEPTALGLIATAFASAFLRRRRAF